MIRWTDYPGKYNMATYASSCTYSRIQDKYGKNLFGTAVNPFDII
jgi:hypothetical protein